jgi:hypothetical protein
MDLGADPVVLEQFSSSYCDRHVFSPACATHQLMGLRFAQRSQCTAPSDLNETIQDLQRKIRNQAQYDFRNVDVSLQRVLVLVESGAMPLIQPVWLNRILAAQRGDGGWSGFEELSPPVGGLALGFGPRGIGLGRSESNFHATAQGVLLMALLASDERVSD